MWGFQNRVCPSVCLSICPYPEKRNHHSFVNISPTLVIDTSMERPSRVLHHRNPKIWFFFQKSKKFKFWLSTKNWNHHSFVNISLTLVIDTSTERSSSTTTWEPKIWFFFFKKVRNWIWLVLKSWNQHSSRSHLYVDIGDASSSLRGSTSSFFFFFKFWYIFFEGKVMIFPILCLFWILKKIKNRSKNQTSKKILCQIMVLIVF